MSEFAYDLNPVRRIIADAHGEPGNRTFFIQGSSDTELISLVLEKTEVANLALGILSLLEELQEKYPELPPAEGLVGPLSPEHPFDPLFRISQLILGYNESDDMLWLIAKALVTTEAGTVVDPDDDTVPAARFVATRDQMKAMSDHALDVVAQGRPVCPLCNRSIDPEGHFCPRTDGHAFPVML